MQNAKCKMQKALKDEGRTTKDERQRHNEGKEMRMDGEQTMRDPRSAIRDERSATREPRSAKRDPRYATAQHNTGVTRGYQVKAQAQANGASWFARALAALRVGARGLRELVEDEIVYATMDTARLLNYARAELRRSMPRREIRVPEHNRNFDVGTFGTEQVRVLIEN